MFWIDIGLSAVLLFCGYIAACCYLNNTKITKLNAAVLRLNKNRLAYLTVGVIAVGAVIAMLNFKYHVQLIYRINLLCMVLLLLPVAAVDMKIQKIPNIFLLVGLIVRCVILGVMMIMNFKNGFLIARDALMGAVIIGLFFLFLLLVFKNSIGMGDIKLYALMGLYQGLWGVINAVFFSLVVSFFVCVVLLITKKKNRKDSISFGPSIFLGAVIGICMAGI